MAKVCKRCAKINPALNPMGYCPQCFTQERNDLDMVRSYVRTHPQVTVMEVHKKTGVSLKTIDRMLRQGDLLLVDTASYEDESDQ